MSTSDQEDDKPRRIPSPIPAKQKRAHTQTFTTGAAKKRSLRGIIDSEIRTKQNTYRYKDIAYHRDIRILKIFHGEPDAPLECMLFTSGLPSTPSRKSTSEPQAYKYTALSYWWGEDEPRNSVKIYNDTGGREGPQRMTFLNISGQFYVRNNLHTALRQLRDKKNDVNVWVDAICINQDNDTEKTAQVARMDEIYSEAENVFVWLGEGTGETKETFDFLREILDLQRLDRLLKTKETPEKWMLVVNLMKNRWFSRRWVIQELALAKKACVRWGEEEMHWSSFSDAIALFMTNYDSIREMHGRPKNFDIMQDSSSYMRALDPRALGANTLVNATANLFRRSEDGRIQQRLLNLEVLVSSLFLQFEASEPKDTIYAVLSLAKDTSTAPELHISHSWLNPRKRHILIACFQTILCYFIKVARWLGVFVIGSVTPDPSAPPIDSRVVPDYDKRLTDVCADFMEYCIETSQSLDILCRHWAPRPKKPTKLQKIKLLKENRKEELEKMPSWIPSIEGHAFGGPQGVLNGRKNGDSFVGSLMRQNQQYYNASASLQPYVKFGKCHARLIDEDEDSELEPDIRNRDPPPDSQNRTPTSNEILPPTKPTRKFDGTMFVKGFKLDRIDKTTGRVLNGVIPVEAFEFGGWRHNEEEDREVPDQLWRTIVADRGPDGVNAPTWYRRACLECLTHANTNGDLNASEFNDLEGTPTTMVTFLDRVRRVTWNRRFFLSKGSEKRAPSFGLAPPDTRVGDVICILFGCSVPVVLRPVVIEKEERYVFIGECYVHGMMDGETIPAKKKPEFPYSQFAGFTLV